MPDAFDNCPANPNPRQQDADGDGVGDVCDDDLDGDGAPDQVDCDPFDPAVGARMDELCNGLDDDCDRRVDEGALNACGKCGPVPLEQCDGRDRDCDGRVDEGLRNACGGCGELPAETCDGQDEDCDGRTDEGLLNACGACGPVPLEVCDGDDDDCDGRTDEGLLNACGRCGPLPPEVCDGDDDDCDGRIDEGLLNRCGGCGEQPLEICDGDDDDCDGRIDEGLLNACGACGPAPVEVCNQVDDDCDGAVDEGPLAGCGCQADEACDGRDTDCDGAVDEGVLNACGACGAVPAEVCDGVDDDCDGVVDEGVLNGCGGCGAVPAEVCNGMDDDCDGAVDEGVLNACGACGEVPAEVCNGIDDDCDGRIDGLPAGPECVRGLGACAAPGVERCWGGRWVCDARQGPPAAEACNGIDDDCDGTADEGVVNACGECAPPRDEVCDGEDNDCDGEADEALPVGAECTAGQGACAVAGRVRCLDGAWRCATLERPPQPEWCNGEDDDCDGATDEGLLNACGECGPAPEERCSGQDEDCDGAVDEGQRNACGGCGPLPGEVCNDVDDDCDGAIDEGVRNGCGGCGALVEVCDGLDDDCDGWVDEGGCGPDCLGNHAGVPEVCNGRDDDGNGVVDEFVGRFRRLGHHPGAVLAVAVDFDGDRHPDVVSLATELANRGRPVEPLQLIANGDEGAFVACRRSGLPSARAVDVAVGDVTGDGLPDAVVLLDWAVYTLTLRAGQVVTVAGPVLAGPARLGLGDLDGDGRDDLLVGVNRTVHWRRSLGGGAFGPARLIAESMTPAPTPRAVDMDGDGGLDVLLNRSVGVVRWWAVAPDGGVALGGSVRTTSDRELVGPGKGPPFTVWQSQEQTVRACTGVGEPRCVDFPAPQNAQVRLAEVDGRGAHHDVLLLSVDGSLSALIDVADGYDGPVPVEVNGIDGLAGLRDARGLLDAARGGVGLVLAWPDYGVMGLRGYELCNGRDDDCDGRVDEGQLACPGGRR